jgi:hypothetical protein
MLSLGVDRSHWTAPYPRDSRWALYEPHGDLGDRLAVRAELWQRQFEVKSRGRIYCLPTNSGRPGEAPAATVLISVSAPLVPSIEYTEIELEPLLAAKGNQTARPHLDGGLPARCD